MKFCVTLKAMWEVSADSAREAEDQVRERVNAPEDDPPGRLTKWSIKAKEA